MSRWQFPFRTKAAAEEELKRCQKETGGKCFVRKIVLRAEIYKVFPSRKKYETYLKNRAKRKGVYVLRTGK